MAKEVIATLRLALRAFEQKIDLGIGNFDELGCKGFNLAKDIEMTHNHY